MGFLVWDGVIVVGHFPYELIKLLQELLQLEHALYNLSEPAKGHKHLKEIQMVFVWTNAQRNSCDVTISLIVLDLYHQEHQCRTSVVSASSPPVPHL